MSVESVSTGPTGAAGAVVDAVVLPSLPPDLLSMKERYDVVIRAKGMALPSADYALYAFLAVAGLGWVPYLWGANPDIDAALRWQVIAIPVAFAVRWVVDLVNSMGRANALEILKADARARGALTPEQYEEYLRRELAVAGTVRG